MSFSQMVKILREQNKEKIVFINAGIFYIAIEEDAVLLNSKLKLKCICFKQNTCKVGVPINAIDKYLEKIENLGYSYIVYNLDKGKRKLKKKIKELKYKISQGEITSKEAKKYLAGHMGYIKIANTYNLEKKLFE